MKRFAACALLLTMGLFLAGCAGETAPAPKSPAPPAGGAAAPAEPKGGEAAAPAEGETKEAAEPAGEEKTEAPAEGAEKKEGE